MTVDYRKVTYSWKRTFRFTSIPPELSKAMNIPDVPQKYQEGMELPIWAENGKLGFYNCDRKELVFFEDSLPWFEEKWKAIKARFYGPELVEGVMY